MFPCACARGYVCAYIFCVWLVCINTLVEKIYNDKDIEIEKVMVSMILTRSN